jgi:hypothetical protein
MGSILFFPRYFLAVAGSVPLTPSALIPAMAVRAGGVRVTLVRHLLARARKVRVSRVVRPQTPFLLMALAAAAARLRSETLTKPLAGQTVVLVVTVSLPR